MEDTKERVRKIDVERLSEEQLETLEDQLQEKTSKIINDTSDRINKYLDVYGLEIKIGFGIKPKINN